MVVKLQVSNIGRKCALVDQPRLQTGHAIILAPMGMGVFLEDEGSLFSKVACFGRRYLVVKTRRRLTADGGSSVLVI